MNLLNWPIQTLQKHHEHPLVFRETVDLDQDLQDRQADVHGLEPFQVSGELALDQRAVIATVKVVGRLSVPSTRSLEPVELPVNFDFTEIYVDPEDDQLDRFDETALLFPLTGTMLSLKNAVEDHILLQIPSRILTSVELEHDQMPAGNGWSVISEKTYEAQKAELETAPNPELAKLQALLDAKKNQTKE